MKKLLIGAVMLVVVVCLLAIVGQIRYDPPRSPEMIEWLEQLMDEYE